MTKATSAIYWVAVVRGPYSSWVHHDTIRQLKRDARAAYLEKYDISPIMAQRAREWLRSGEARIVKVRVGEVK